MIILPLIFGLFFIFFFIFIFIIISVIGKAKQEEDEQDNRIDQIIRNRKNTDNSNIGFKNIYVKESNAKNSVHKKEDITSNTKEENISSKQVLVEEKPNIVIKPQTEIKCDGEEVPNLLFFDQDTSISSFYKHEKTSFLNLEPNIKQKYIKLNFDSTYYKAEGKKFYNLYLSVINVKITKPKANELSQCFFKDDDQISILLIVDEKFNLVNFSIYKTSNGSFGSTEKGDYLFKLNELSIEHFGISQFSYLQANDILKKLLVDFKIK